MFQHEKNSRTPKGRKKNRRRRTDGWSVCRLNNTMTFRTFLLSLLGFVKRAKNATFSHDRGATVERWVTDGGMWTLRGSPEEEEARWSQLNPGPEEVNGDSCETLLLENLISCCRNFLTSAETKQQLGPALLWRGAATRARFMWSVQVLSDKFVTSRENRLLLNANQTDFTAHTPNSTVDSQCMGPFNNGWTQCTHPSTRHEETDVKRRVVKPFLSCAVLLGSKYLLRECKSQSD